VTLGKTVGVGVGSGLALLPPPNTITRLKYKPKVKAKNLNGFMVSPVGDWCGEFYPRVRAMSSIQLGEQSQSVAYASRRSVAAHILEMPRFCLWAVLDFPEPAKLLSVPSEQPSQTVA
jgi:hypothetical protein